MPVCANLEFRCTSNKKQPCPWWLRTGLRIFFGCLAFFISVEFPFLPSLAGLISAIPKLWYKCLCITLCLLYPFHLGYFLF
ncbi:hypothetical protein BC332_12211 [Capsicum chinense]|nr:hypothetical protein BC332_12211 [Capsicum chinense]